jgi:hypothetical protein
MGLYYHPHHTAQRLVTYFSQPAPKFSAAARPLGRAASIGRE